MGILDSTDLSEKEMITIIYGKDVTEEDVEHIQELTNIIVKYVGFFTNSCKVYYYVIDSRLVYIYENKKGKGKKECSHHEEESHHCCCHEEGHECHCNEESDEEHECHCHEDGCGCHCHHEE